LKTIILLISIAKLKQKHKTTKHFVTFLSKKLTFCHLIDLNQEYVTKITLFVVLDNNEMNRAFVHDNSKLI